MTKRGKKSNCTIAGHTLSWAEVYVLDAIQHYMRANAGDSHWSPNTSPKGDGRSVSLREIFADRNISANAKRHSARRLGELGVLQACQIEIRDDMLRGDPHV